MFGIVKHFFGIFFAVQDICTLALASGRCMAYFPSWGYDKEIGKCVKFIFGGCEGNKNRFESEEACTARCPTDARSPVPVPVICKDFKNRTVEIGEHYRYV